MYTQFNPVLPIGRLLLLITLICCSPCALSGPTVAGWIELARVSERGGLAVHAKLDTGAEVSSIHAIDPEFFERDGNKWVRFSLVNRDDEEMVIERPIERIARITRHFGNAQERPVIMLGMCIGDIWKTAEVNLVDRSGLKYKLLIGRNFLGADVLIDSSRQYRLKPACEK